MALTFFSPSLFIWHSTIKISHPQHCHSQPEVKTKPIHLHIIVLYYFLLAISHNSEKNVQIIGLCFNIMNEMCYLEESQGGTDLSPLSWPPPPLSAPFGRGELSPAAVPPSPFHFSQTYARHLLSKQGRLFANSPHSYMIDNRKPLSSADFFSFSSACAAPHLSWKITAPGCCPVRPCQKPPLDQELWGQKLSKQILLFFKFVTLTNWKLLGPKLTSV